MTKVVVITGLSGSGKTLALRALEDMGFFAVDNLPAPLWEAFADLLARGEGGGQPRGAFVSDVRERGHIDEFPEVLEALKTRPDRQVTVVFFEASDETLVRRFSESRRPHPLAQEQQVGLADAIRRERALLSGVRRLADRVIDTSDMSPHELRRVVQEALAEVRAPVSLACHVVSFGFKFGAPRDADMVFDVRFLPNPFFLPHLRHLDGRSNEVVRFFEELPDYREYLRLAEQLLAFVMPRFVAEGKSYLTVAVGCTGGRHRSVAIGERLARFLTQAGFATSVSHRDVERDAPAGRTEP